MLSACVCEFVKVAQLKQPTWIFIPTILWILMHVMCARRVVQANRAHWLIICIRRISNKSRWLAHAMPCHFFGSFSIYALQAHTHTHTMYYAILFNMSEQQQHHQQQKRRYTTKMRRTLQMRLDECEYSVPKNVWRFMLSFRADSPISLAFSSEWAHLKQKCWIVAQTNTNIQPINTSIHNILLLFFSC